MQIQIAKMLLDLGAVSLAPTDPFTWASGLKSPIYCDNRLVISNVEARRLVISGFVELVTALDSRPDLIGGTATAGIPHAAWLAEQCSLPMIYVRSSEKAHGRKNQIEGKLLPGQTVFLVEDLVSTGGSSVKAAEAISLQGGIVIQIASIFSYGLISAEQNFRERHLPFKSLTTMQVLLQVALEKNLVSQPDLAVLTEWARDPKAWSNQWIGR